MKGNVWEKIEMVEAFGGGGAVVEGSGLGEEFFDSSHNLHRAKGLVDVIVRALLNCMAAVVFITYRKQHHHLDVL